MFTFSHTLLLCLAMFCTFQTAILVLFSILYLSFNYPIQSSLCLNMNEIHCSVTNGITQAIYKQVSQLVKALRGGGYSGRQCNTVCWPSSSFDDCTQLTTLDLDSSFSFTSYFLHFHSSSVHLFQFITFIISLLNTYTVDAI